MNIDQTINLITNNWGYVALAFGWLAHVYVPHLIRIYPTVISYGGVIRIVCNFFYTSKVNNQLKEPNVTSIKI